MPGQNSCYTLCPGLPYNGNKYLSEYFAGKLSAVLTSPTTEIIKILFTTPFVYVPGLQDSLLLAANIGYIPQALIDWMAQNPIYDAQYPGLAACTPGGPLASLIPLLTPGAARLSELRR